MLLELAGKALRMRVKDHVRLVDKTLRRVKAYAESLEDHVAQRTEELQMEMIKCDNLLREILPR